MISNRVYLITLALATLLATGSSRADDLDLTGWSVGLGGTVITSPYASADDMIVPIPYISYQGDRFAVSPIGASFAFLQQSGVSVSAILAPRFQAVDRNKTPALKGMADRNPTAEAGLRVDLSPGFGMVWLEALTDIASVHRGQQLSVGYGARLGSERFNVTPRAALVWQSGRLGDYYYGVRKSEARQGRAAYSIDDAVTWSLGVDVQYALARRLSAVSFITYDVLPKQITSSPIVDADGVGQAVVGLIYKF